MEKLDIDHLSIQDIAEKVNELVHFANITIEHEIIKLEKDINYITYGKQITNEEKIKDLMFRVKQEEIVSKFMEGYENGKTS